MYPSTSGTYTSWILLEFATTTSSITLKIEGFIDIRVVQQRGIPTATPRPQALNFLDRFK